MSPRGDRLAGLAVLAQALGAAGPVATDGVDARVREALGLSTGALSVPPTGSAGEAVGGVVEPGVAIVVQPSWALAGQRLTQLDLRDDAWAWLLTSQSLSRQVTLPPGWGILARFAATPSAATPTHLVNLDIAGAPAYFARTIAPAWGVRTALRREAGRLRALAPAAFPAFALLVCRGVTSASWPLTLDGAPAIIALGGGSSAGRTVLTYLGIGSECAMRYVKVDPAERRAALTEHDALVTLQGHPLMRTAVPMPAGTWTAESHRGVAQLPLPPAAAAAQTGVPGIPLPQRWSRRPWQWASDIARAADWLAILQGTRADLPVAQATDAPAAGAPTAPETLGAGPAYLAGELGRRVEAGLQLAEAHRRPVHGDFWPGNILRSGHGLHVIDWECAHVGHPLQDVLTLVVTGSRLRAPSRLTVTGAALAVLTRSGVNADRVAPLVAAAARRLDRKLQPHEIEDLVLSAMVSVIRSSSTPAVADPARAAEWAEALLAVWADWQADGSPWAPRPKPVGSLRVVHVLDSFSFGGAENLVVEAARHARPSLTLRALSLAPEGQGRDAMLGRLRAAGLAPRHLGVRRLVDPTGFIGLVRAIRRVDADVVHAHLGYAATLVPIAARLAGKPVVATLHHYPADLPRGEWLKERLSVAIPARLGRLVLVSHSCFEEFDRRHGPATAGWLEVPNGVDVARFSQARPLPVRADLGLGPDAVLWAVVAALRAPKGHEDLIAAWADVVQRCPQAHLAIAGDGPHRETIERAIAAAGLASSIHLVGRVEDVPGLLAACDALVSASHTEALPTGLIEAGAAGLPVVATRAGGSCDIVVDGQTGLLVEIGDTSALSAAVCRLTADRALRVDLGRSASRRVAEFFSMEAWLSRLEQIYRDLLTDARTGSRRG